jgi:soluble lytic murein transglycosylase
MRWVVALVSIALALGPGRGPASAGSPQPLSTEQRDRFVAALAMLRSGDPGAAARELGDPVWTATPLQAYAHLLRAEALLRAGDASGARAAAARAVDDAPDGVSSSALLRAATVLSAAGDEVGAVKLYRWLLDRQADRPEAPRARSGLARSLLALGRVPDAARVLTELWLQAPASPEADDAARQLRILDEGGLAGSPVTARERIERAERLLAAGLGDAARGEAEALYESAPPDLRARVLRITATAHRRGGRLDAAQATVNRALTELPVELRAPWLLDLARLQQRRSRDLAIATLDKLAREYAKTSEAAEALGQQARLLEAASRLSEAEAAYGKLVAEYPDQEEAATALWRLGWLAWFRGAYGEAAALWGRSASGRGGPAHREAAAYWIARASEQLGAAELAARQFAQVQADAPRSYYGILAGRRAAASPPKSTPGPALPADPREPLRGDARFARVEALRAVGLAEFADEEMDELTRRSQGELKRLYALSVVYAQDLYPHLALRILRRHFQPLARSGASGVPRLFWETFYPLGWRAELTEAAGRSVVDPFLVAAVVREESSFFPQARSPVGARGLMQIMPDTARPMARARGLSFGSGELLDDPGANLELGSAYLAGLVREFGDARLAAAAYNAGPGRVREWWGARRSDDLDVWVEQIPFNETRGYVKRVMLAWDEYRRLYASSLAGEPQPASGSSRPRPWPN